MPTSVSAIVVNWNGAENLPECLDSLAGQSHSPQVIVVDNASLDGSETVVRDRGAEWLPLPRNVGLAAAFNEGAKVATGELLLFLNNDMRFAADFVQRMIECLERNPGCLAIDAVQRDWDDHEVVHGAMALTRGSLREPLPGWRLMPTGVAHDAPTAFPSGANTLIAAETFRDLGGWDPRFFAGYEDVDLGWRIWLSGGEVRLAADAICWHKVGASSDGEGKPIRRAAALHGPLLFAMKHAPARVLAAAVARLVAGAICSVRRPREVRTYSRAIGEVVRDGAYALAWRRRAYGGQRGSARRQWQRLQPPIASGALHGAERGR